MKKIILVGTTIFLVIAFSLVAFAGDKSTGSWQQDTTGWWWQYSDGTYPKNEWVWIDGDNDGVYEDYYFDEQGYCLMNTTTPDGKTVNSDGAWVKDGVVQTQGTKKVSTPLTVNYAGEYGIKLGTSLTNALSSWSAHGISPTSDGQGNLTYQGADGYYRYFRFDENGICRGISISKIFDKNTAIAEMERLKSEISWTVINYVNDDNQETYMYGKQGINDVIGICRYKNTNEVRFVHAG